MARTIAVEDLLGRLIDGLADRFAARVGSQLKTSGRGGASTGSGKSSRRGRLGRKLDMSCRVDGCKNASRGPRFGFICDDHRKKLSKKNQQAARDAWKARATAA